MLLGRRYKGEPLTVGQDTFNQQQHIHLNGYFGVLLVLNELTWPLISVA